MAAVGQLGCCSTSSKQQQVPAALGQKARVVQEQLLQTSQTCKAVAKAMGWLAGAERATAMLARQRSIHPQVLSRPLAGLFNCAWSHLRLGRPCC
jgi:hypothetical protein